MKKIYLLFILFFLSLPALASCYTGFACSIDGLQTLEYINNIENYFAKDVLDVNYLTGLPYINSYNDLFMFNTVL